jgi:hypothetical protein
VGLTGLPGAVHDVRADTPSVTRHRHKSRWSRSFALAQEVFNDLQSVKHGQARTVAVIRGRVLASALRQLFLTI